MNTHGIDLLLLLCCVKVLVALNTITEDDVIVELANPVAKIKGHILKSQKGNDYIAFQEIPFGEAPVEKLRFKQARRHQGWTGILNTTANTRVCPQILPNSLPQDEDCLHVNVYTPVKPSSLQKLAVYVWIHGGAHMFWDATINRYGPKYLMDYGIVVVTMHYRMGSFGFLTTEDGVIPGNLAFWDQNLALRWVQDNIHRFGGDPTKVTIGGESSGASSVSMHILSPHSKGLFRGAIQESGSAINTYNYQKSPDHNAFELGKNLDSTLNYGNSTRLLEILQTANVSEIIDAQNKVVNTAPVISVIPDLIWAASIEKSVRENEAFLWKPMQEMFASGDFNRVPMLLGYNTVEMLWFISRPNHPSLFNIDMEFVSKLVASLDQDSSSLINDKLNILDAKKAEAGSLVKKLYTNSTFQDNMKAYIDFASDAYFIYPTINQAELASRYVDNVFLYEFAYSPDTDKLIAQGAEHTEELQYFWHNVEDRGFVDSFQSTLSDRLLKLWTNFIKYQNPTPLLDIELWRPLWPKVHSGTMKYMKINKTFEVYSNPRKYSEVTEIKQQYKNPPYTSA